MREFAATRLPSGPAIFRAPEHMQRLLDSAKIYRIDVDFTRGGSDRRHGGGGEEQWRLALLHPADRAARVWRSGVNPFNSPTEVYICNYPWGKYLGTAREGVDVCVSSWTRLAPNTLPAMAKAGANYMNSQLIKMEAMINGYVEGIALDANGYVSEGSGENVFMVRNGVLQTAPLGNSVLPGITRDSVLQIAATWEFRWSSRAFRAKCSTSRMKLSSPERRRRSRHPLGGQDQRGQRRHGSDHERIQQEFFAIVRGEKPDRF